MSQQHRTYAQIRKEFSSEAKKRALREQLKEGANVRAERDLALVQEWFALDEET